LKILLLTNLFPLTENLSSGIFITKRLEQYKKLGIEYVAVPVWFQDDLFVRLAKYLLRKSSFIPVKNVSGVDYSP
jgi:teichuronic acid biosynthesis glycosyltransferase TuaC